MVAAVRGPKAPGGSGVGCRHEGAPAATADGMVVVGSNDGLHTGQFPHILRLQQAHVVTVRGKIVVTGRAVGGIVVALFVNGIRLRTGPLVPRVAHVCSTRTTTRRFGRSRRRIRGVRRGRFGGGLRELVELRLELGNSRLKVCKLCLELDTLLLIGYIHHYEGMHHRPYRLRCASPILGRNVEWW